MKKVLVINGDSYYRPFKKIGVLVSSPKILERNPQDVALVVFSGGCDVWPGLYNDPTNHKTHCSKERCIQEKYCFNLAVKNNIPIWGTCRGAQLFSALCGGKIIQDVSDHFGDHTIKTLDGRIVTVNSIHHQMQLPPKDAIVLAISHPSRSTRYERSCFEDQYIMEDEPEAVYYPSANALGVQYHPEMMHSNEDGYVYTLELLDQLMSGELKKKYGAKNVK